MNEYILIFRHEDASKSISQEQMQQWMQQTMDWINDIAAQNKFSDGKGLLFDEARVVHGGDKRVSEKAFGNLHETIGGYIIVRAESIEEAIEFAKGSPVLQGQHNSVEVRRIAR
ncbi:YciI family protein [Flavobacterium sp.]|uniref:YciI family protein n=1 Tax=Flavobacterium sp. TaxID=239 RepID=UPI0039E4A3D8